MHPIAFHIAGVAVRYAGLLYLAAIIVAWAYAARVARRRQWSTKLVLPGVALVVSAAYMGARIHGAMQDWEWHSADLLDPLRSGALSFFGGLGLGAIALIGFLRWARLPIGAVADELSLIAPVLYALFRLGCLLNGDDYGRPTSMPWGMSFPEGSPPTAFRVHPVPLYEVVLMIPVWFVQRRRGDVLPDGVRSFDLCVLLGIERFLVDFLRPSWAQADYLAASQWFALALIGIGAMGRSWLLRRKT